VNELIVVFIPAESLHSHVRGNDHPMTQGTGVVQDPLARLHTEVSVEFWLPDALFQLGKRGIRKHRYAND
jgi:hypothetical protein